MGEREEGAQRPTTREPRGVTAGSASERASGASGAASRAASDPWASRLMAHYVHRQSLAHPSPRSLRSRGHRAPIRRPPCGRPPGSRLTAFTARSSGGRPPVGDRLAASPLAHSAVGSLVLGSLRSRLPSGSRLPLVAVRIPEGLPLVGPRSRRSPLEVSLRSTSRSPFTHSEPLPTVAAPAARPPPGSRLTAFTARTSGGLSPVGRPHRRRYVAPVATGRHGTDRKL